MKNVYAFILLSFGLYAIAQEPVWKDNLETYEKAHAYYDSLRDAGHSMKGIGYPNFMRDYYGNILHWANDNSIETTKNATRLLNEAKKLQMYNGIQQQNTQGTLSNASVWRELGPFDKTLYPSNPWSTSHHRISGTGRFYI